MDGKQKICSDIMQKEPTTRYSRTSNQGTHSKNIIPITAPERPRQTMDLSRGLTIDFSYGGNNLSWDLHRKSSNKGFILQWTSVNFRGKDSTYQLSTVPCASQLHIDEISRCAERISKILKGSSSGLVLHGESIDVGRQLLRGATDLEESLEMLASLQEASKCMENTQMNLVKMLKGKDDEDEPTMANKEQQISGRRVRSSSLGAEWYHNCKQESGWVQKASFNTRGPAVRSRPHKHTSESMKTIHHAESTSYRQGLKFESQFPATNYDSDKEKVRTFSDSKAFLQTAYSCTSNWQDNKADVSQVNSGYEKRTPNVIAKLMGLEYLPLQKREPMIHEGLDSKVILPIQGTRTTTKLMNDAKEIKVVQLTTLAGKAALRSKVKINVIHEGSVKFPGTGNVDIVKNKEKPSRERMSSLRESSQNVLIPRTARGGVDRKGEILPGKEYRTVNKTEREKENEMTEALISKEAQGPSLDARNSIPKPYRQLQNEHVPQEYPARMLSSQANSKGFPKQNPQMKLVLDGPAKVPNAVKIFVSKYRFDEKSQHAINQSGLIGTKQHIPMRSKDRKSIHKIRTERLVSSSTTIIHKKSGKTCSIGNNQVKHSMNIVHPENIISTKATNYQSEIQVSESEVRRTMKIDSKSKENTNSLVPCKLASSTQTEKSARTSESWNTEEKEEEAAKCKHPNAKNQCIEQDISCFQEMTQKKETYSKSEDFIMLPPLTVGQNLLEKVKASTHDNHLAIGDAIFPEERGEAPAGTDGNVSIIYAASPEQSSEISITENQGSLIHEVPIQKLQEISTSIRENQDPCILFTEKQISGLIKNEKQHASNSSKFKQYDEADVTGLIKNEKQHASNSSKFKQHDEVESNYGRQELLTDDENQLKGILVKSQLFLERAQALFSVRIPLDVIQASKAECLAEQKIILDCGYEVMNRKGKRQECTLFSTMEISPPTVKQKNMDSLIKELYSDLKNVTFSCLSDKYIETSQFLHQMVEKDIYDSKPDLNCMWDFGWKMLIFAGEEKGEIIKDLEKHVLNSLINDIVREFMIVRIDS